MTKAQIAGLAKLIAANGQFEVVKDRMLHDDETGMHYVKTGVNTTVLHSLRQMGYISCTRLYLRGVCTSDFAVTDAGRAAVKN